MSPIVAFAKPEELPGLRQVAPVDAAVATFEEGRDLFLEDVAHCTGGGVGDTQEFLLMIARRADKGQLRAVFVPLYVGPFPAAAGDVVAQSGAVLIWR